MRFISRRNSVSKLTLSTKLYQKDIRDILLSAVLFIFSYAPSPFGFLIYIAFIPQFYLYKRHKPGKAFLYGYLIGVIFNAITLYWLFLYAGLGYAFIVCANSLQFAIFGSLMSFIFAKNEKFALVSFPFLWTFLEYSRQFGDLAFNWLNIAYSQSYFLYLIQFVDITGYSGIVTWICLINISIYILWENRQNKLTMLRWGSVTLVLFLIPLLYGFSKLSEKSNADGISVSYIQPNIELNLKWNQKFLRKNLQILTTMTDSIMITNPDLVVWPETGIPYYLKDVTEDLNFLNQHIRQRNYHLLTGAIDFSHANDHRLKHNAAYFFTPGDSNYYIYRKLQLVPIEEKIPYKEVLPEWLIEPFGDRLTPGDEAVTFHLELVPYKLRFNGEDWQVIGKQSGMRTFNVSAVICYESVYPNLVKRFFKRGTDLLTVITNDSWFGYTSLPFQHLQAAVFRAIEQRSSIVRCANTGVSSFIDPYGRRFLDSHIFEKASAQKIIPFRLETTFYSKHGDLLSIFSGILVFCFLTLLALSSRWKVLSSFRWFN